MKRSCGETAAGATADDDEYWAGAGEGRDKNVLLPHSPVWETRRRPIIGMAIV